MTLFKNLKDLLGVRKSTNDHSNKDQCLCMVVSEQEGAEIWIQGVRTNYVTPKLIAIPKEQPIEIEVRLTGHESHKACVRSSHNLTYYYCNLKRLPFKLIHGGMSAYENTAPARL